MQYFYSTVAQMKQLSVFSFVNGETGFRIRTIDDRCAGYFCQVKMPAHKIGMEMSFENVFDLRLAFFCQLEVGIDVPERVYNCRLSFAVDIISRFTEATGIQLLNEHNSAFPVKVLNPY